MQVSIRETEKQKVAITADPHLGHNPDWDTPLWKARGYSSVEEHDDTLIDSFNTIARPNDILLIIGDFCLNTTVEKFNSYLDRIKCQNIWYVWGNHNNPHEKAIYRKAMGANFVGPFQVEQYPFKYKNFMYVGWQLNLILNGQFSVVEHFPVYVWDHMQHGAWMLCGHSHNGCELSRAETLTGKILDCGWDGHGKPWTFEEIKAVMDKKKFVAVDHHHPEIQPKVEFK